MVSPRPCRALVLLPLLAGAGCLERDISRYIEDIGECTETTTGTSTGTTGETTESADSGVMTTTVETTTSTSDTSTTDTSSTTAASSTTDASSTTGEPIAECGNGIVDDFGPDPEDCDDGNDIPDDGCSNCGRDRLVFVTSDLYQGGVFNGLGGADQRCRSLADQAGLPNFAGFKAWLSDSQTDARDRLFHGRGRYVLINGLVVADNWDALVSEPLQNPINVTQISESLDYFAWTGTNPEGTAIANADHCADWTKNNLANKGFWGNTQAVSAEWTLAVSKFDQPDQCGGEYALYCFEQE